MAQSKLTPQEFIRNAFTPQVAVICSPRAEESCRKNNLCFVELLQPFCKIGTEVHYKDPNGAVVSLRNFKVALQDINDRPPQPALAKKFLHSAVRDAPDPRMQVINIGECELEVPLIAPWFETWRDTFLQVQYPSDHEFTKHFLACLLVVSTADENPLQKMLELVQKLHELQAPTKFPKWFSNDILRYYIIIHENLDPNHVYAVECYDSLMMSYGAKNCFLLRLNSRRSNKKGEQLPDPWSQFISVRIQSNVDLKTTPETSPNPVRVSGQTSEKRQENNEVNNLLSYHPLSPDDEFLTEPTSEKEFDTTNKNGNVLHGACLTMEDVEQLKLLIHEFCTRALLPYVEKQVQQFTDLIANKKGVSRSIFTATKRWFTPNKPGSTTTAINTSTYYFDAPELQIRRLGDLYFMFGHYTLAFQAYHTAKRDFNADQAWLHYAGALEMAALSAFMANESSRKTFDYMEESITTYLNTCKTPQFAARATLLSSECLKNQNLFGEAANQLIRMTSEDSDLSSALLLEQAAYCFLHAVRSSMVRKYAFHMVLAGHRFSKAAQRKHSLRCYKQAYQIYKDKGWNLAQDHIHYTIGRQANNLNNLDEAVLSYSKLLTGLSRQSTQQQALFLKEYLTIFSILQLFPDSAFTQELPLPLLDSATKVLVGPAAPLRTPGRVPAMGITLTNQTDASATQRWIKLEEMLVQEAQGSLPMIFKPLMILFTSENSTNVNPTSVLGEPIQVSVKMKNPLQILLHMKDICLLWRFTDSQNTVVSNETGISADESVKTQYLKSVILQANSTQEVILVVTPMVIGKLVLEGICYRLISSNSVEDQIVVWGKQDFSSAELPLHVNIVPSAPCLQVSFSEINSELLRNELQQVSVELRNVGCVPLCKIYMATSTPQLLSSCDFSTQYLANVEEVPDLETPAGREREARKNHVSHLPLLNGQLDPGQHIDVSLWIKAPEVIGPGYIDLLIYYENTDASAQPKYRLVRHMWHLSIQESIKVDVTTKRSCNATAIERLTLSIKAVNMNRIHHAVVTEISLLNAALLSPNWVLLDEVMKLNNIRLLSQESVHMLLKAQRKKSRKNEYSVVWFVPSKQSLQYSDVAYLDFAQRNGQLRINIFDETESQKKRDATLILRWQAHVTDSKGIKRTVYGQSDVSINIINVEEQLADEYDIPLSFYDSQKDEEVISKAEGSESVEYLQKQITCNLKHPPLVVHDFKSSKFCTIPVYLILHSIASTSLVVTIKTSKVRSSQDRPALYYPYSSEHFRWICVGNVIRTLEPLSSEQVQLSLAVLAPGTYNLGAHLEVWCHQVDHPPETAVLQSCQIQSSLIIASEVS